jgi:hypothetical protein
MENLFEGLWGAKGDGSALSAVEGGMSVDFTDGAVVALPQRAGHGVMFSGEISKNGGAVGAHGVASGSKREGDK